MPNEPSGHHSQSDAHSEWDPPGETRYSPGVYFARHTLVACSFCLISCTSSASDDAVDAALGADEVIVAFDGTHVYFGEGGSRTVDLDVVFPAAGLSYESISLSFALRCPNDRCDWWDRVGWLAVVEDAGGDNEVVYEVLRFVTPYRVGGAWTVDTTSLRPLLTGTVTVRVFIDTWVGPGHPNGDGWLVDAAFDFAGGVPANEAFAVVPLTAAPRSITYGDPANDTIVELTASIPVDASRAVLRSFVTGHGQGNADNCAEFCARQHWFDVAGTRFERTVWRSDCATTAVPNQQGTWTLPRAGWCPGDIVASWGEDLTGLIAPGELAITYDVQPYENTCRPDAAECTGCVLGTGCEFDSGNHTSPHFLMSALLVLYR